MAYCKRCSTMEAAAFACRGFKLHYCYLYRFPCALALRCGPLELGLYGLLYGPLLRWAVYARMKARFESVQSSKSNFARRVPWRQGLEAPLSPLGEHDVVVDCCC